jgi:hypothetical protein
VEREAELRAARAAAQRSGTNMGSPGLAVKVPRYRGCDVGRDDAQSN